MKKYLVIATVLVALVALFSISASAADIALADVQYTSSATGVTINRVAIGLSGAPVPSGDGYYTVLAYTGAEDPSAATILFVGQEITPITSFSVNPASLNNRQLYVKCGGSGVDQAGNTNATYAFSLVAFDENGMALDVNKYTTAGTKKLEVTGADSILLYGAEIRNEADPAYVGFEVPGGDSDGTYAHRVYRQFVEL